MAGAVTISEKKFVGIGKMVIDTIGTDWNIPALHFMVDHTYKEHYEATSLEFGLVVCGDSQEEATKRLAEHIHHYIVAVMTGGGGFDELEELARNDFMSDYWSTYRYFEFSLARRGKDLSHIIDAKITRAIQNMFDDKVKEIITQKAAKAADELIREYEQITSYKVRTVTYADLREAA
jgi:hypothetical protein